MLNENDLLIPFQYPNIKSQFIDLMDNNHQ